MALQFPHISKPVSLGNVLIDAYQRSQANKRQEEQDMAEKLKTAYGMNRQRQGDQQADFLKARELMQAGDIVGAQAIMARHGAQQEQYEVPGQQMPQAPAMPQMRPQETADPNLTDPNEISQSVEAADWKATNPIAQAFQAQQAQNKKMAMRLKGQFEDGTPWSLDPEAAQGVRQQRLQQSFGQSEDPDVRGMLPQLEAAYGASMEQPDPKEIFAQLRNTTNARRQESAADARERMALDREDRRDKRFYEHAEATGGTYEQKKELARIRAQAAAQEKPETGEGLKAEGQTERILRAASVMDTLPPIDATDRDVILKHLAQEELYEKNPTLRVAAQAAGLYKTLPEKLSEQGNLYWNQMQEVGAAILRKESGASISLEEWRNVFQRYAPVRGESAQAIANKRANMYEAARGLANESRKGGARLKSEIDKRTGKSPAAGSGADKYKQMYRDLSGQR